MLKKRRKTLLAGIGYGQIFLIITSIFAFAFLVGVGESEFVSSQDDPSAALNLPIHAGGNNFVYPVAEGATLNGESVGAVWSENGKWFAVNEGGTTVITEAQAQSLVPSLETTTTTPTGGGITEGLSDLFSGKSFEGGNLGHLTSGLLWGAVAGGITYMVAGMFGASDKQAKAAALAVGIGTAIGRFGFLQTGGAGASGITPGLFKDLFVKLGFKTSGGAFLWTIGISAAIFILTYKDEEVKRVEYQCLPWEPPLGGERCEDCNKDPFRPCSEYRCRSLGQACELVNSGTKEEACVWVSKDDVESPTITPWPDALTEGHRYASHDTRPPSLGTKILNENAADGCLQAFTPLEFGIILNEPAQCKVDILHTDKFDKMAYYFGESNFYLYNHTQVMSLPSPESLNAESPELQNDGIYDLYVRCRDANGNENVDEFVFSFCVDPSPDTTPPIIVDTSLTNGAAVTFGAGEIDLEVYVNEPVECKWSVQDKNYEDMENAMSCSTGVTEINARLLYTCSTTLDGIVDREENKYYFRCKDQPSKPEEDRNVNVQSYEFTLVGTQPLNIIEVGPNETITGSTDVVPVELFIETSNGAEEGKAICSFSNTGEPGTFVAMFETNNFEHKQLLNLPGGEYNYHFRCVDMGGNSDNSSVQFEVEVDTQPPMVTRAYKELDALKIVTDEDAECVYSLTSCNYVFDEGLALIYSSPSRRNSHFVPWQSKIVYHIKCRDDFGNEPNPIECSLIASATNIK